MPSPDASGPGIDIPPDNPEHIAIIMDGNGRWATSRNRPRTIGHQAGLKALRSIVGHCGRIGTKILTVFAFSSENWNRPQKEVNRLMDLFMRALDKEAKELDENGVRLSFIGDIDGFSQNLRESIRRASRQTEHNQRMTLNVAVNYGGRWDIVQAARSLARKAAKGLIDPNDIDEEMMSRIESDVLVPVVHAMKRSRKPFKGVLYAGLMLTAAGPKVLEFNVRFGDPECQPLLMRLKTDLVDILEATVDGRLGELPPLEWDDRPSICVVMASEGYPGDYEKGCEITGLAKADEIADVKVFHAGTKLDDGRVLTNGGRVLGVTALGNSISGAKLQAYTAVKEIRWPGAWCRKDISDKALN